MILAEPGHTKFDIKFSIFGFFVRIHPAFFIMPLLLGGGVGPDSGINAGLGWVIITVVFLISILVHELGHTFAFRYFGIPSSIVLYWMGGLAIPGGGNVWSQRSIGRLSPNQQIVVSLAGPMFGFGLAGLFIGIVYLMGGVMEVNLSEGLPRIRPVFSGGPEGTVVGTLPAVWLFLSIGILVNVLWGILNLMPIFPLDGGQVSRELFQKSNPRTGLQNSLYLSIGVGIALALFGFSSGNPFIGIFFAYMAFINYQTLQSAMRGGFGGRGPW